MKLLYYLPIVSIFFLARYTECKRFTSSPSPSTVTATPTTTKAISLSKIPDWPPDDWPDDPSGWLKTLKDLYDNSINSVGFCFGTNPRGLQRLLRLSFAWPLPTTTNDSSSSTTTSAATHTTTGLNIPTSAYTSTESPNNDYICSNLTVLGPFLCAPREISLYYRFMLLTENPEKVPNTAACPNGASTIQCSPGYFDAEIKNRRPGHKIEIESIYNTQQERQPQQQQHEAKPYKCCPGYFCPANLACMMPCPQGSYCPRAVPALPPKPYRPTTGKSSHWCAPYAYKEREEYGCGGADRWTVVPAPTAFPTQHWTSGSGSLYCDSRYYCPNTTTKLKCPKRHFCRLGSVEPERCPPGAWCPAQTSVPKDNYTGLTADALLLGLLWFVWWVSQWYGDFVKKLRPEEEQRLLLKGDSSGSSSGSRHNDDVGSGRSRGGSSGNGDGVIVENTLLSPPHIPPLPTATTTATEQQEQQHQEGDDNKKALEVEFNHLSLRLHSTNKFVLNGASGRLQAGRTTAILGCSGAGKTSLLNALAGRSHSYGEVSGDVTINGRKVHSLERYKRVMGFVPQDDILHPTLTVEEHLLFSARYRLPRSTPTSTHLSNVQRTLSALGLFSVKDQIVGDASNRGISGGQRKRVNIGVELVADPLLLLLDEPTSGLDAAASKSLVATLGSVARSGVTAAAVIHQPSHQAFFLFDDLLLLGRGGRTVYYGTVTNVQLYFEGLGFMLPEKMNPADAYLDIVSGELPSVLEGCCCDELPDVWSRRHLSTDDGGGGGGEMSILSRQQQHQQQQLRGGDGGGVSDGVVQGSITPVAADGVIGSVGKVKEVLGLAAASVATTVTAQVYTLKNLLWWNTNNDDDGNNNTSNVQSQPLLSSSSDIEEPLLTSASHTPTATALQVQLPPRKDPLSKRKTPNFLYQYWLCLTRSFTKRTREPLAAFTDYSIVALAGMTVGLLSDRGTSTIMSFSSQVSYSIVALGLMAMVGALSTFGGRDRLSFTRESASGLNRLSYFLALDTFDVGGTVVRSAVYLVMWTSFASPRAILWQMYAVTVAVMYCCTGIAYFLSLIVGPGSAQLAAAVLALTSTLLARQANTSGPVAVLQSWSYARWALEGMVIAESNRLTGVWLLARCADLIALNYDVRNFLRCILALAGIGVVGRCCALLSIFLFG